MAYANDPFINPWVDNYPDATDRNQIRPDHAAIERFMSVCSVGEGVFIGAVCSFYNGDWGLSLGKCHGCRCG
ncbi:MAG: hypothetical protein WBO16_16620 [Gammaproteobacteria bacterium]